MKILFSLIFIGLVLVLTPAAASAQHCPFDGGMIVAVRLTDHTGAPFVGTPYIKLLEKNAGPGIESTERNFLPTLKALSDIYGLDRFESWRDEACGDCKIFEDGVYAVHLKSSEVYSRPGGDAELTQKEFVIEILKGGSPQTLSVENESIFSLCYSNGKWSKIVPIEIQY